MFVSCNRFRLIPPQFRLIRAYNTEKYLSQLLSVKSNDEKNAKEFGQRKAGTSKLFFIRRNIRGGNKYGNEK
ncbi:MAG: hypothetical protein ABIB71_04105 [Candidatus Woesearchaeota archaeon]